MPSGSLKSRQFSTQRPASPLTFGVLGSHNSNVFLLFCPPSSLTEVGRREQDRALAAALSDSLWLAGQETSATVTLVTEDYCITSHVDNKLDTFTERVPPFLTALRPLLRPQHLVTSLLSCLSAAALHVQREGRHHQLHPRPHPVREYSIQSGRQNQVTLP